MESLLSAIMSDLMSRALSMVIERYYTRSKAEETEHKLQRLQRVLLRIDATVEEAEGRHITNQAMLRQLDMLRQGMYSGHYMLDTFRYRGHGHGGHDNEVSGSRDVAFFRFSSAKRLLSFPISSGVKENPQNPVLDAETLKNLEKMLGGLEALMGDMAEFAVFLDGYPRICRQPYSEHLVLEKVMFGRQMEKETVINFLLRPETLGDGNPGVLPIVGRPWVGKSTLVEHVCLNERVRGYFSSIVFFYGDDLDADNMAALGRSGVVKHQDLTASSRGRSLVVIELTGDMEEETWRSLYCSAAKSIGHGGKIIITSRSEKIAALGTTQALRLQFLPQEAYWYFFKVQAFGSANPDDQPKLASLCMEIAAHLDGSFLEANVVRSLMRAYQSVQCWRRVLQCFRDFKNKHILTFGKDPTELLESGHPVALSMVIQRYKRSRAEEAEHKLQQLQRVLFRVDAMVEAAEGRHITNQAMLRQLEMLRQGMYGGHYMLDTIKYRGDDEVSCDGDLPVALPGFSSAKQLPCFPVSSSNVNRQNTETLKKLEKMLDGLETLMGDMLEFAVFLQGYPRICRQPYSTYLILGNVMFGRQMEMETVVNFLLRPEAPASRSPGVLPIIGLARIGKRTLVEHSQCCDQASRCHCCFTWEWRSLAVIELAGDMDEEAWSRLYCSAASSMGQGSKIVITSRSEKIAALGTTKALRLKALPQEAYWYFFKALAFGSANPSDQPKLASLAMEIAALLNGTFLGANIVGSLMRANQNTEFWFRLLQCLRDYTRKHIRMFGEHPTKLTEQGRPVQTWSMARSHDVHTIIGIRYQKPSPQDDAPDVSTRYYIRKFYASGKLQCSGMDINRSSLLHLLGKLRVAEGWVFYGQEAPSACKGVMLLLPFFSGNITL
ncbi:unnamed protein product [Urochloa decumbens]|uniref:Disease resistance N-terminal domain-containing protein n=1 Tax=Urochloa decumbens TaxID=240449 RepID=A0ABC8ZMH7_9POAL